MGKISIIYGSTTGNTENAANQIANELGVNAMPVSAASTDDFEADVLILGSSTWGIGELQDDWLSGVEILESMDLNGKKVAVFGTGDQSGFSDSYCDAMGILAEKATSKGATLIGKTSIDGYLHCASVAQDGDFFVGLALDEDNESFKTADRISDWVAKLKEEF